LSRLFPKVRKERIYEVYKNTIGEKYARRATNAAGQSDKVLRANSDFATPTDIDPAILSAAREQLSENLSPADGIQNNSINYQNDSDRIRGYLDWNNLGAQLVRI